MHEKRTHYDHRHTFIHLAGTKAAFQPGKKLLRFRYRLQKSYFPRKFLMKYHQVLGISFLLLTGITNMQILEAMKIEKMGYAVINVLNHYCNDF